MSELMEIVRCNYKGAVKEFGNWTIGIATLESRERHIFVV